MSWRMSATIHKINPTSSSTNPLMMVLRCFMQGGYHTAAIPNASRCYGSPHPEKLQYMATMGLDFPRIGPPIAVPPQKGRLRL